MGGRSRGRLTKRAVEREKEIKRVVQFIAESTYQPLLHHSVTAKSIDLYLMMSENGPENNRNLHQCVHTHMCVRCMHVCMYVCIYVRTDVCMLAYVRIYA